MKSTVIQTPLKKKNSPTRQPLHKMAQQKRMCKKDEIELALRIANGDRKAIGILVQANLGFVAAVCHKYRNQGVPLEDLVSEGTLGLFRAAEQFDINMNCRFISYAVWWIRQAVLTALAEQSRFLKISPARIPTIQKILKSRRALEQRLARYPSQVEIAEHSGICEEKITDCEKLISPTVSLNKPKDGRDLSDLVENLPDRKTESPDHLVKEYLLRKGVIKILGLLDWKKSSVMKLYFGLESEYSYSMPEIATKLDLSTERIRQIIALSLKTLQHPSRRNQILTLLSA